MWQFHITGALKRSGVYIKILDSMPKFEDGFHDIENWLFMSPENCPWLEISAFENRPEHIYSKVAVV